MYKGLNMNTRGTLHTLSEPEKFSAKGSNPFQMQSHGEIHIHVVDTN